MSGRNTFLFGAALAAATVAIGVDHYVNPVPAPAASAAVPPAGGSPCGAGSPCAAAPVPIPAAAPCAAASPCAAAPAEAQKLPPPPPPVKKLPPPPPPAKPAGNG